MKQLTILFIIGVLSLSGCVKKETELQFEQKVFNQLFISLVNATYKDTRLYHLFPAWGKDIYNKQGKWIGKDTTGQHYRDSVFERKREALVKDTIQLVIAIKDFTEDIRKEESKIIIDHFKASEFKFDLSKDFHPYKIDLNNYKSSKFVFKYLSELPVCDQYKYWSRRYDKFAGELSFSRIQFDARKENGALTVAYNCGGKCGLGYVVFIKKKKDTWIIVKVLNPWIS